LPDYIIYTDGAASHAGQGGWSAIVLDGQTEEPLYFLSGGANNTTNNDMEFLAALQGLRSVREYEAQIIIRTDSELLIGYMAWNWAREDGKPHLRAHRDHMEAMIGCFGFRVTWEHVSAHVGHKWNEQADKIAVQGRKTMKEMLQNLQK
jgi:ribonuclease HI